MRICPACGLNYPADVPTCFVDGIELIDVDDPLIGSTVGGRYQLEAVIGSGGMATVYRARHRTFDRPCAVKVMLPAFAHDEVVRERFRREARSTQKLAHPNIIEILDQGEQEDGSLYLVMELLEGETLADVLDRGRMPVARALGVLIQVARALARAHDLEVVHRDLKPENIFLTRDAEGNERVVLLDFGIARSRQDLRLTGAGELFGTPQYMAPERITSIDAGPPADLYAVGVIAFEMFTGRLPFEADGVPQWFVCHLKRAPLRVRELEPALPQELEDLVAELLEKDPQDRPTDAHSLNRSLLDLCATMAVPVPAEPRLDVESSARPATLPPANVDAWHHRLDVFQRMLDQGFADAPPEDLSRLLRQVEERVREVGEVRARYVTHERQLEDAEVRAREGRQRFGHAVDALGVDASHARSEAKEAATELANHEKGCAEFRQRMVALHERVVHWEGRCGFTEPHRQLAEAYRDLATLVEEWGAAHAELILARQRLEVKRNEVVDIEFQIQALRTALATFEQSIEAGQREQQAHIGELGKRADELDSEIAQLASRLCAPLRKRPELRALFRELESETAA